MDEELFNKLKIWRLKKAKELKIPAYIMFHNSTLLDISDKQIYKKTDLLKIKGIGPTKIESYGDELIEVINEHYKKDEPEPIEEIVPKQKKRKVVKDVTRKKNVKISIDKDSERRIKNCLQGKASEMVIKYTLSNYGYQVLRGERWLDYHLNKKKEYFRDAEQIKRISQCTSLCKRNRVGLPDFFIYSDTDEFFLEVKSNNAKLNCNQKEVFPKINKIIPIKIIRVDMKYRILSLGMIMEDYITKKY